MFQVKREILPGSFIYFTLVLQQHNKMVMRMDARNNGFEGTVDGD
jgi:hypothetical protein